MKKVLQTGLFLTVLSLIMADTLLAQALYFYNADYTKYPVVSIRYLSRDASGGDNYLTDQAYQASHFEIKENGVVMNHELSCAPTNDTIPLQLMFIVNSTPTMNDGSFTWVKDAMKFTLDSMRWVKGSKVALVSFVGESKNESNFNSNKDEVKAKIDAMVTSNGPSDYGNAFKHNANPFAMFDNQTVADYPRAIVFVTNREEPERFKEWTMDVATWIFTEAKKRNIVVNFVTIGEDPNENFKYIPRQTGGLILFPKTKAETIRDLRKVVTTMQINPYCRVFYTSGYGCDQASKSRAVELKFMAPGKEQTINRNYNAPESSIPKITLSKSSLDFGKPSDDTQPKTVTITNVGPETTIQGLTFSTPGLFEVKNLPTGKKLLNNESFDIQIGYSSTPPETPTEIIAKVKADDFLCQETLPSVSIKCDWFVFNAEQVVNETFFVKTVMEGEKTTETIKCGIKNTSSAQIRVKSVITDDADGDFTIKTGGGEKTMAKGACLNDLVVEFAPKKAGSGTKTAKVHITVTEPAGITDSYDIALTGKVIPTSVEEIYTAGHNLRLSAQPNPFGQSGKINLTLDASSYTSLDLYNAMGARVENIIGSYWEKGSYTIEYNTKNLVNGVYYLKLINGNNSETLRIIVNK